VKVGGKICGYKEGSVVFGP